MQYKELIVKNKLKEIRKSLGLRQQDVATILGFAITDRISNWEKGKAVPSIYNLFRLASIYNISIHDLYSDLELEIKKEVTNKKARNTIQ